MRTDALGDLLSLRADALELLARRLRFLFELLQACGGLWGATRAALLRRVAGVLKLPLSLAQAALAPRWPPWQPPAAWWPGDLRRL